MTASQLLRDAAARGIALRVEGNRLRWKAPAGRVTEAMLTLLRNHKSELIQLLAPAPSRETEDRRAFYVYAKNRGFPQMVLPVARMTVEAGELSWRAFAQREGYYALFEAGIELEGRP